MDEEIREIFDYFKKYMSIKDCIKVAKIEYYISNLKLENERLLRENITKRSLSNIVDETIYKSRIEKAIEYLKSKEDSLFMTFSDDILDHDELIDKKIGTTLLNILNGKGSDE